MSLKSSPSFVCLEVDEPARCTSTASRIFRFSRDEKKKLDGNENARQSKQPKKSPKTRSNKIFQRAVSGLGVCWACLRVIVVVMWKCRRTLCCYNGNRERTEKKLCVLLACWL